MDGGGRVEDCLASIARAVKLQRVEVSAGLQERLIAAVPEFRGDARVVELLLSAVLGSIPGGPARAEPAGPAAPRRVTASV
jgi:hypothetical protein